MTPPGMMDDQAPTVGRDIRAGDRIGGYHLGGVFTVARIDPEPHRTSGGETARSAYDAAGRGLVVFCDDSYPLADDVELVLFGDAARPLPRRLTVDANLP